MKRLAIARVLAIVLAVAGSAHAQSAEAPAPVAAPETPPVAPPAAAPPAAPAAPPVAPESPAAKIVLPPDPPMIRIPRLRYANTWDLNLEAGVGTVFRDADRLAVLGRGRAGVLLVRDNNFWQLGVTAEYLTKVERPAFGLQAEYLNLENGLWTQLGVNIDTKTRPGGMAALGLSIVGVEVQVREFEGDGNVHAALLAKIRIPIGIIAYALGHRGQKL